jgi:hypothetical protein
MRRFDSWLYYTFPWLPCWAIDAIVSIVPAAVVVGILILTMVVASAK